jgi:uncharacterized protein (TIGR02271 family)
MQHTLVAVFDNRSDAQNALDELLASGFDSSSAKLSSADPTGESDSLTGYGADNRDQPHEEGIGASIKHFFTGLFGADNDEHVQKYSTVVSRGHYAVTLITDSEPEVERAADVIERFGPIDIDEHHDKLVGGSGATIAGGNFSAGAGAALGSGAYAASAGSFGTQPGALQSDNQEDRNFFATQSLNDPVPKGQTYQEPMGASMQSGGSLDSADGQVLSGTQSSSLNPGVGTSQQSTLGGASQSGGLTAGGSTLQGTASLQGSDDASLGGTVQQGNLSGGSQQYAAGSLQGSRDVDGRTAIPVVQEDLKIGKREVQRGGVRVFSRIIETPVNESVNLREEHVNVERRPVDQPISAADVGAFKEQSIEMRETAEEAVVQKSARVVEEVLVNKEVTQRQEQINDTVRRTDVQVEQLGADSFRDHYTSNFADSGHSYDDLQPAYLYGSEARRAEKYRNREWSDVESDLRSDWDTRHGSGGSTWEKIKAAARHGWDKVTPDMDSTRGSTGSIGSTGSTLGSGNDDAYYRNHWSTNYASSGDTYDSYAPAYQYGAESRSKYSGRDWNDVEPNLRSDWDSRYGNGGSTWEKFKAAARHGYDRVTS